MTLQTASSNVHFRLKRA